MDVSVITQLVGSLGFPIVCCGYMMIKMNKTLEENTKATNELASLISVLVQQTEINSILKDEIEHLKEDGANA